MPKLIVLLSHDLTPDQVEASSVELGCTGIKIPPDEIREAWSSVPPEADDITTFGMIFISWLLVAAKQGDYLLLSGDYGITFMVAQWALENGLIPVYSTGERDYTCRDEGEKGIVNVHRFKHVKFRRFRYYECGELKKN